MPLVVGSIIGNGIFGLPQNMAAGAGAEVTVLNSVVTVAKVLPLVLSMVLVALMFQLKTFQLDFCGDAQLGSVLTQVKSTMLVTV